MHLFSLPDAPGCRCALYPKAPCSWERKVHEFAFASKEIMVLVFVFTCRRSWMQYLENKVVPVLAGAIAYLDTNNNLDLLYSLETDAHHSSTPQWARQVWLEVLQSVCQLNYKHLRSMSDKDELDEFTVHHTGAGALPFSACLPFSWLLWELVDSAISGAKNVKGRLWFPFNCSELG